MKKSLITALGALIFGSFLLISVVRAAPAAFGLPWWTIDGGGGRSNSGDYVLGGAIGQPDAGVMNGGTYALAGGFWHGVGGGASETYYTLVVAQTGTGLGIITPTVGAHSYFSGTTVWLTATAASSSTFGGWQGAVSGSPNPVSILMDSHKAVTATFTLISGDCYTLTTTVSPPGGGSVRANPIPNCGGEQYAANTVVTLTAVSNDGYHFDHWGGAASGAQNPVTLTLSAHTLVTAHFVEDEYFLYLPLIVRQWPPVPGIPSLNSVILGDFGHYTVTWSSAIFAEAYILEEASESSFSDAHILYQGPHTSYVVTNQLPRVYRVKATGNGLESQWSNIHSIYLDDFSSSDRGWQGWAEGDTQRWRYVDGRYEGATNLGGHITFAIPPIALENYVIQVELYPIEQATQGWHGLFFGRSAEGQQTYLFSVTPGGSMYSIDKYDNGWTDLALGFLPFTTSTTHITLKVVRQGTDIQVYVDGFLAATVSDNTLTGLRYAGLAVSSDYESTGWVSAQFDNFVFTD